jgi:5,6-dimethylbenzimidazole synthase
MVDSLSQNGRFSGDERDAVYRAIFERRDVRKDFIPDAISEDTLRRILMAAHHAGSVGYMQPWDFLVIQQAETKHVVKNLFVQANDAAALQYKGEKADLYRGLKLEGIEEAPINICVTCTRERGGPSVLGRATVPETDLYSTCCAIQNLWLAARAEGIGVGWVSIMDYEALKDVLGIPQPVWIIAYLCVGYVKAFADQPDLEKAGWRQRVPLDQLVHYEAWGKRPGHPFGVSDPELGETSAPSLDAPVK